MLEQWLLLNVYKHINQSPSPAAAAGLVDLDGSVDLADEEVRGVEADRPGQQPEGENHQSSVAEVQQCRNEFCDLQLQNIQRFCDYIQIITQSDYHPVGWCMTVKPEVGCSDPHQGGRCFEISVVLEPLVNLVVK